MCQKLIIICPVIFQKTESPQLALGGTEIGSGNHCILPGLLEKESERLNSVENGTGPLMAVLGFFPCFQGSPSCPHLQTGTHQLCYWKERERFLCCFILNLLPLQSTKSKMEQTQALEPGSLKVETKPPFIMRNSHSVAGFQFSSLTQRGFKASFEERLLTKPISYAKRGPVKAGNKCLRLCCCPCERGYSHFQCIGGQTVSEHRTPCQKCPSGSIIQWTRDLRLSWGAVWRS